MPVAPTYPGVYIEEIPSGVRTITGVATSITAFVGRALRGPVNDPITINNYGDYERNFGGLWGQSAMSYAVRDFFGNGGGQAIIVRLYKGGGPSTITTPAPTQEERDASAAAIAVSTAAQAATGNKQAIIDAADTARDEYLKDEYGPHELAAANSVVAAVAAVREADGSMADMKRAAAAAADVLLPVESTTTTVSTSPKAKIVIGSGTAALNLEAAYEGLWGNGLEVIITLPSSPAETTAAKDLGLTDNDTFNLYVTDTTTGNTESFLSVSVVESARQLDGVLKDRSALIRVDGDLPTARPAATPNNQTEPVTTLGSDGEKLDYQDFTTKGDKEGLYALENADLFNLLCIPPHKIDGEIENSLIGKAATYAEKRRAFFIVDPPTTWLSKAVAKTAMQNATLGSTSKNAAVFFPRLRKPDPLRENQLRDFVPCGAVAGVIARTDSTRGLWKAPAGLDATLKGVPALSIPLTDAENGELNPLGLNCLRAMGPAGRVIWGSRTTQGNDQLASEWKYLSVRRVALYIEESLYRGTHWAVFEPNDEPLWSQIRLNLGAFMHNMFRQGAFQGSSPKDAYFVKCDSETTTQNDINLGIVNILIGFAPLKPAEFVIIKLQQIAGQVAA
ncbi:MAG: phage tail sheath family protein [Candidatus Marinimicrobia bacterium]|nr:phage tail sheath family protein [Candidatus Neomarinimicrobiota bacterium]